MKKNFNPIINKLVIIFIVIQPLLDIYAGTNIGNIHIIIRGIFLIGIILYNIKYKNNLKLTLLLTTIMFIYFTSYLLYYKYSIINSISYTFKLFYLPFTTIFFINYKGNINNKYISITNFLYILLFLLCYIFNLGDVIYEEGVKKEGFKGLFNSINELSAIVIILLPLTINNLLTKKKYILTNILIILTFIMSMLTGTKVMLGGLLLTTFYFLYKPFSLFFKSKTTKVKVIISSLILATCIGSVFLITNTTAYKNVIVQAKFFKIKNIISLEGINKVIFNDRFSFVNKNQDTYLKSSLYEKIFGLKYDINRKDVEIDLFDIFYKYGLIGLLLIISIIIYYGYKSRLKKAYLLSFILFITISETSGHILISPAVSIYLGMILYLNKKQYFEDN